MKLELGFYLGVAMGGKLLTLVRRLRGGMDHVWVGELAPYGCLC